jgi:predicted O-methyltransferase YrrM
VASEDVSLASLLEAADAPQSMTLAQAEALFALLDDHRPDMILELGRARGNSTSVFTAWANERGGRVVSVGYEGGWGDHTEPILRARLGDEWLAPLTVINGNIRRQNYAALLDGARRPLVFWDAHGRRVARTVLKRIVPLLPPGSVVVVHDIAPRESAPAGPYLAGPLSSTFPEVKPLWRFLERTGARWWLGVGFAAFSVQRESWLQRAPEI